jgi:hypothetical protein
MRSQRSLINAFGARKTVLLLLLRDGTTNARSEKRAYHLLKKRRRFFLFFLSVRDALRDEIQNFFLMAQNGAAHLLARKSHVINLWNE